MLNVERGAAQTLRTGRHVIKELSSPVAGSSTGFVTLTSVADREIAMQFPASLFRTGEGAPESVWTISPAPESPSGVVWRNASVPIDFLRYRARLCRGACLVAVLFWQVPVLAIQAGTNQANIEKLLPEFAELLEKHYPYLYKLVIGYLPVVAIQGLFLVLPYALEWMSYLIHNINSYSL